MTEGLKVFIVSEGDDVGGVGIAIQRAFERYGGEGWQVRSMRGSNNYIDYPADLSWDPDQFHALWAWADVIHAMEKLENLTGHYNPPGKPLLLHHHGMVYRWNVAGFDEVTAAHNLVTIASTIDLTASPGVEWLPNPIDIGWMQHIRRQYRPAPGQTLKFVHSPTAFRDSKGTSQWQPAVRLVRANLKITQGASWSQALAEKASGDVHLDQLTHGYGLSGLEAMAMGIPVVSGALPEVEAMITARLLDLPYLPAHGRVNEAIVEICDPGVRAEVAARGWAYVNEYHAQPAVVDRLKRLYLEAMDRFDPAEEAWA